MTSGSARGFVESTGRPLRRGAVASLYRREVLLLTALVLLSCGTAVDLGALSPAAITMVLAALALIALAARAPDAPAAPLFWACAVAGSAAGALVYGTRFVPFETYLAAVLVASCLLIVAAQGLLSGIGIAAATVTVLAMAVVIWRSDWLLPRDVVGSLSGAGNALLHGVNPYLTTFRMPAEVGPGLWTYRIVHFQYLPGAALVAAVGQLLGDVRFPALLALAALVASSMRLASTSPDERVRVRFVLALCLASPLTVLMLRNAWVDVYGVAAFAGWVALRRNHPRWATACLALSMTIKPTIAVLLVPWFVWSRSARRETLLAASAAGVLIVPFAITTGLSTFYQDVIGIQTQLGFRYDGLTLGAAIFALARHLPPIWFGPPAGAVIAVLALRRRPVDVSDMLIAGALLCTAGFVLAKWAFFNYYFMPAWMLILGVAGRGAAVGAPQDVALPAWRTPLRGIRRAADLNVEPAR